MITAWVLSVIPLLALTLGYLLLYLPEVNRALWHSASQAAHLAAARSPGHQYAEAAADALGAALALVSIAGSLYVAVGLVRRAVALGQRWSAGRPRRRLVALVAGLACACRSRSSGLSRASSVTGNPEWITGMGIGTTFEVADTKK